MRKDNVLLAAAIAATLVVPMSAAYAGLANYGGGCGSTGICTINFTDGAGAGTVTATATNSFSIISTIDADQGIMYGTHLFGASGNNVVLPATTNYAAAEWTVEGTPGGEIQVTAEVDGASFVEKELYLSYKVAPANPNPGLTIKGEINSNAGDCNSTRTKCTWLLSGATDTLHNDDKLYVVYKLNKAADRLKEDNGQVKMTVKLGTATNEDIMGKEEIVIATGTDPLTVTLEETFNTNIKIATAEGSKGFISTATTTPLELFNSDEVIFGYLTVKQDNGAVADDGYTPWALGDAISANTIFKAAHSATDGVNTMLTIKEGGQFAASLKGSKGSVNLRDDQGNLIAEAKSVTENEAIWELTDENLNAIATGNRMSISVKVDGETMVNVPEEDFPKAQLTLSYAATNSMKDIKYPPGDDEGVLLTKYRLDGTVCWVYNVAFPAATDEINIRITNDSTVEGCVKGSLFGTDGTEIGTGAVELGCVQGGATLYIGSAKIAELFNLPSDKQGRGVMLVTSTLPRMEMLSMLRAKSPVCYGAACSPPNNYNPLTNISVGAHGVACVSN